MLKTVAQAIKEVFGFLSNLNDSSEQQKRYLLKRVKRIKKAINIAEDIFVIFDQVLDIVDNEKLNEDKEFLKLKNKYNKLKEKFNNLD